MRKSIFLVALLVALSQAIKAQPQSEASKKLSLVNFIIENLYVDNVDANKLAEDGIRAMLEQLDPHSTYLNPEETAELSAPLDGNFDGIGVQFIMDHDTVYVVQTIVDGPSEKVGIRAGDRIIAINDTVAAGVKMSSKDIMKKLRGKKGTTVNVSVLRRGVPNPIQFRITRDKIPVYSIDASFMVDKETGYVRLSRFAANSGKEFAEALLKLRKEGMKSLILDLQGNGGGYLNAAIDIANMFLSNGELIVYTKGRKVPRSDEKAGKNGLFRDGRLVILVDESSASASEILSGAVQDWDRGIIVGRRTFGKGLVQRPVPLPDGSMVRLTTARYYTPSGRSIQKPYEAGKGKDYNMDLMNRYKHGELYSADSIHFPDSLKFRTLKNDRVVYGGGGIMPDYFVPLDTTKYTDYHRDIIAKGVMNQTVTSYIDRNRKDLQSKYKNADKFIELFNVDNNLLDMLKKAAEEEKVKFDEEQYQKSLPLITSQLKALVARDLFDISSYFKVMNQYNDSFRKGLEIIRSDKTYNQLLTDEYGQKENK